MSANVQTMAYNKQAGRPWHGQGVPVEEAMSAAEAIKAGGLDWKVEKKEIYFNTPDKKDYIKVSDKFANVRMDNGTALGIVGKNYTVMNNCDAFSFFDAVVTEKTAIYETVGALGKGERIWLLAKLPKSIEVVHNDIVDQYMLLSNSHDGSSAISVRFTPIRVVCQNTLISAFKNSSHTINVRHTPNFAKKVDEARRVLGISSKFYESFKEMAKVMARKQMTPDTVDNYINSIMGKQDVEDSTRIENIKNEMVRYIETGKGNTAANTRGTLWAAYNGICEYTDYGKKAKGSDADPSKQLESIWYGNSANIKLKAWNSALELVKAGSN